VKVLTGRREAQDSPLGQKRCAKRWSGTAMSVATRRMQVISHAFLGVCKSLAIACNCVAETVAYQLSSRSNSRTRVGLPP
jgi:hypothetical protein